jgi:enoyl-CoA hydratase
MQFIKVNPQHEKFIAVIELNRPKELNALNRELMLEIRDTLRELDEDDNVRVIILTGGQKVFAAGADIKQMASCHRY